MNNINQYAVKCLKDEAQAILDLIPQLTEDFSRSIDLIYNCRVRGEKRNVSICGRPEND